MDHELPSFGPSMHNGSLKLSIWAPGKGSVGVQIGGEIFPAESSGHGFWNLLLDRKLLNSDYRILIDGKGPFPDPASRFMPEGISGPSRLYVPNDYGWKNKSWKGITLPEYLIEEVHIGTFTVGGTYGAMEEKLDHISETGITAVEIMPVAEFYGKRNWGYDGVYIYSPHYTYGTPAELMKLVDSIHSRGMSAILDVVYNHGGPFENYMDRFGPFYSSIHRNAWGNCYNFDGEHSSTVREFIIQNAIYWLNEYRFDALRLDAVHGIHDSSPRHILKELSDRVKKFSEKSGRNIYLFAESDRNDRLLTTPVDACGYGIDAQWNDDFHHSLHHALTGEKTGYYIDFTSDESLYDTIRKGFLYQGEFSEFLNKYRGTRWGDLPKFRLVAFSQNHDQIGNRAFGKRLISLAGVEKARIAASVTLLSPFTPLIFMGEEIGETSPFLFFIDAVDPERARAINDGRRKEFLKFEWETQIPDPNEISTFVSSRIKWEDAGSERGTSFLQLYRDLIKIRKKYLMPVRDEFSIDIPDRDVIEMKYGSSVIAYISFSREETPLEFDSEKFGVALNTEWREYGGSLKRGENYSIRPYSAVVLVATSLSFP